MTPEKINWNKWNKSVIYQHLGYDTNDKSIEILSIDEHGMTSYHTRSTTRASNWASSNPRAWGSCTTMSTDPDVSIITILYQQTDWSPNRLPSYSSCGSILPPNGPPIRESTILKIDYMKNISEIRNKKINSIINHGV